VIQAGFPGSPGLQSHQTLPLYDRTALEPEDHVLGLENSAEKPKSDGLEDSVHDTVFERTLVRHARMARLIVVAEMTEKAVRAVAIDLFAADMVESAVGSPVVLEASDCAVDVVVQAEAAVAGLHE
jgi:hypothetical protein